MLHVYRNKHQRAVCPFASTRVEEGGPGYINTLVFFHKRLRTGKRLLKRIREADEEFWQQGRRLWCRDGTTILCRVAKFGLFLRDEHVEYILCFCRRRNAPEQAKRNLHSSWVVGGFDTRCGRELGETAQRREIPRSGLSNVRSYQ